MWAYDGLKNIRFSGGEPTLYKDLNQLATLSRKLDINRVAISTNGSASPEIYQSLLDNGVNDFSISLDACCSEDGNKMSGGIKAFDTVTKNIERLSKKTYVTVGIVLTTFNQKQAEEIIVFADSMGVSDIRVIPAAQEGQTLPHLNISESILKKYPILAYRENNFRTGKIVRGNPTKKCGLVLDDMAIMGWNHYPCIIYMREGGEPIGKINPKIREERKTWYENHDCQKDSICSKNCLDVCVDYNKKFEEFHPTI
jgi:molybdenum cofactor biosynthesis enzyme MoaA